MEQTFIMMIGIPGSGKSSQVKQIVGANPNIIVLSSDLIRSELFTEKDVYTPEHNRIVFETLHARLTEALAKGESVIYDATNINSKRRKGVLSQIRKSVLKECYYFATPVEECISRDLKRKEPVGVEVINRMYKTLQVPSYLEGWETINIIPFAIEDSPSIDCGIEDQSKKGIKKEEFAETVLKPTPNYDITMPILFNSFKEFAITKDLAQDNPYHSLSLSRHIFFTFNYLHKHYEDVDRDIVLLAGLFHDLGKPFCKEYTREDKRYASFFGHENVSGQLAIQLMMKMGYTEYQCLQVAQLVSLHMKLSYKEENYSANRLARELGNEKFQMLLALHNADLAAK